MKMIGRFEVRQVLLWLASCGKFVVVRLACCWLVCSKSSRSSLSSLSLSSAVDSLGFVGTALLIRRSRMRLAAWVNPGYARICGEE